jgi:hypothetical protein
VPQCIQMAEVYEVALKNSSDLEVGVVEGAVVFGESLVSEVRAVHQ